jgi:hypothetical protein
MNTLSVPPSQQSAKPPQPPRLRPAAFDDYEGISRLVLQHSLQCPSYDEWQSAWTNNPAWQSLGRRTPIGWVLETETGRIVGTLGNVPIRYRFCGAEIIASVARAWTVDTAYRGFAAFLLDEYLNQPGIDLFVNTAANAMAGGLLGQFCARVPLGQWDVMAYRITRYHDFSTYVLRKLHVPFPEIFAYPAAGYLRLLDAFKLRRAAKSESSIEIESIDGFDTRFDVFWQELLRQKPNTLLCERSAQALSWHFGPDMRAGKLWIFVAVKNNLLRGYCIFRRQYAEPDVRRMRLIDYQTLNGVDLLPAFLEVAVARCASEPIFVLENVGVGVPKMRAFDEFAPCRKKLADWPCFYHAVDSRLDADLRSPEVWDPSLYDGHYE